MKRLILFITGLLFFSVNIALGAGLETFESGARTPNTKVSYASGNVYGYTYYWNFNSALIGTSGSDVKAGSRSARIQSTGSITMLEDKTGGLGTVTIKHALFGSDPSTTWRMDVSDDGGGNWTAYSSAIITSSLYTLATQSFTVNVPGDNIRIRIVKLSGSTSSRLNIDDISLGDFAATQTITTAAISGSPFCITTTSGASVSVNYTTGGVGVFNAGNVFTAQLSDASGSFSTPVDIGNVSATASGTITATIPAATANGAGYKIRVVGSDPVIIGSLSAAFTIRLNTPDASGLNAIVSSATSLTVSWTNPTLCFDEVMLVAATSPVTFVPSGAGAGYTPASLTYGPPGYNFSGTQYLILKGTATSAIISGLITNTQYYFKLFVRKGSVWSDGIIVTATPTTDKLGDFRTRDFTTGAAVAATWNLVTNWEYHNGTTWVVATGVQFPANATGGTVNVTIGSKATVTVSVSAASNPIGKLTVDLGGRLYANASTASTPNRYLTIWGDIVCNGNIGNGAGVYDVLCINTDGANQTVSGTGSFNICRIRKNTNTNAATNLTIAMNVNLMFAATTNTGGVEIYNNSNTSGTDNASNFNVTVNQNSTLNLQLAPASSGNVSTAGSLSIDNTNGEGGTTSPATDQGGTFTINGTLNVPGTIFAYTNNTSIPVKFIIGTSGVVNCVNFATANAASPTLAVKTGSAGAGSLVRILDGGKLNLNGGTGATYTASYAALTGTDPNFNQSFSIRSNTALPATFTPGIGTNNTVYDFQPGSTVEYSNASGSMGIQQTSAGFIYSNILVSGAGTKTYSSTVTANKNVTITSLAILSGGANNLTVGGNWDNYATAGFTEGTGTVSFNGTTAQNIYCPGGENFYKASFAAAGTKTLHDNISTASDLTINTGSGAVIPNGNTVSVAGNWLNTQGTTGFTEGTDKVIFNGVAAQTITATGGENFYDLTIKNAATYPIGVTQGSAVNIASSGTLFIETGSLDALTNTLDGAGNLSMNALTNLTLAKNGVVLPELTGIYSLTGGAVIFNGTGAQTIRAVNFFDLTSTAAGTRILPATGTVGIGNVLTPGTNIYTLTSSTVDFNGSGDQDIPGFPTATAVPYVKQFNILKTSIGGIKTTTTDFTILDNLSIGDATTFNAGTVVTIKSDATNTARVAAITGTAAVSYTGIGKFNIERFIPLAGTSVSRRWRLLCAPISTAGTPPTIKAAWQENSTNLVLNPPVNPNPGYGTTITKTTSAVNGFDIGTTSNPSIYYMSNAGTWAAPTGTDGSDVNNINIASNAGYMLFVRGDRGIVVANQYINTTASANLRVQGQINTGDIAKTYTSTTTNQDLIFANPYPSAIDMHTVTLNGTPFGSAGTYYLWDPKFAGSKNVGGWVSFLAVGSNIIPSSTAASAYPLTGRTGIVESGEAFLVKSPAGGTVSVVAHETDKDNSSTTIGIASRPISNNYASLYTNLSYVYPDGRVIPADGVATIFGENMRNKVDDNDAPKLTSFATSEKISLLRNNQLLSIETRQAIENNDTVFYTVTKLNAPAKYKLNFEGQKFSPGLIAILEDKFTATSTLIDVRSAAYSFVTTTDAASVNPERFKLVFRSISKYVNIKGEQQNADIAIDWTVANEGYIKSYEIEKSADGNNFNTIATAVAAGNNHYQVLDVKPAAGQYFYYRIKIIGNNNTFAYSNVIKVKRMFAKGTPEMYVYPNPVKDGIIGLQLNNEPAGTYNIKLMNELGQILQRSAIIHPGGTATSYTISTEAVQLSVTNVYHVEVINTSMEAAKNTFKIIMAK